MYRPYEKPLRFVEFVMYYLAVYNVDSVYGVYRHYKRPLRLDDFAIS